MADFADRYPLNISGKYYVTGQCTDCDLCRQCAPKNIRRDDRSGISYVFKQPSSPDEIAGVEEGVAGCPTEAVGNDGDRFDWDTTPIFDWNAFYAKSPELRFELRAPLLPPKPPHKPERSWWRLWKRG